MIPIDQQWWESLTPQWRQAFSIAILKNNTCPANEDLHTLGNISVLRLAGPSAPHPNCTFELTELSGITALKNLQILIVSHHALTGIEEVALLPQLKSLFIFNNRLQSLRGIEKLHNLEQLYVQCNELHSIAEVEGLIQLKELYVSDNRLTSLAGLNEKHADHLEKFVCMPNEGLKQKDIIHTERELGIICR